MSDDYTPVKKYFTFEITTTQQCNMGCSYCFEGAGDDPSVNFKLNKKILDREQIEQLKEKIHYKLEHLGDFGGIKIDFWGGEPTLNKPIIKEFLDEFKGHPVRYHLYSNGYDIRGFEDLIDSRVQLQISYDGVMPDPLRLTLTGKDTTQRVRKNILKLLEIPDIDLHLKATLVPEYFKHLDTIWDDYEDLYYKFREKGIKLSYSPTIDYYNDNTPYMEMYKRRIVSITKKELKFAEKNGELLFSWYGGRKGSQCAAGQSITSVTVEGETLACHGAIYQDNREELTLAHLSDPVEEYFEKLEAFRVRLASHDYKQPEVCVTCPATTCVKCPALKSEISAKELLEDRWYDDSNQPQMCEYFQFFGKVDRAFQEIIVEKGL
jgi:uncharacterized protein